MSVIEKVETKTVKTVEKPDYRKYLNVYEFDVELPSGIKLKLKPINAGQLKKFMTSIKDEESVQELSQAMYEMIKSCIVGDFDMGEIYLNDRPALILELRKISKGAEFKFEYKCPECKSQSIITENLNNITVLPMPVQMNPIVILDDNLSVQMDYVKIKDEQEILDMGMESETELLLSVIAVSIKAIISPEGSQDNLSLQDRIYFTDNIPQQLYRKLTKWHDDNHFGVDMNKNLKCVHCGKESDQKMDADNFFF
jgi:DNA-directed RNA polymerase subunit RPC12/RpoP